MKNKFFAYGTVATVLFIVSCGGSGSGQDGFVGNYAGTFEGNYAAKGQSGTVTIEVTHGSGSDTFNSDLYVTKTNEHIGFTGTVNPTQEKNQSFTAIEDGGPYDKQTLTVGYNPDVPTKGSYMIYVYAPTKIPNQALYALSVKKVTTKPTSGATTGSNADTTGN